jgi:glycerate 2-kinase
MIRTEQMRDAERIFRSGIRRVDPYEMTRKILRLDGSTLILGTEGAERAVDLGRYDRVIALGVGKASARMALGLESVMEDRLDGGLVVVKEGYSERLRRIDILESSHPIPDERSLAAAEAILSIARSGDERTLFIGLVSGGGSSLLCLPIEGLGLEDKKAAARLLVSCGADIGEINCVRKHLSAIKGGKLAAAIGKASAVNLMLSDVIGDDIGTIASGPTAPDPTSFSDALGVVERYGLRDSMPVSAMKALESGARGELAETPKPGSAAFARSLNLVIGSNRLALAAAEEEARTLGYACLSLGSRLEGEAKELGRFFLSLARGAREDGLPIAPPACILGEGETTVTIRGKGKGGRNQEAALAFLAGAEREPRRISDCCFLSAGSDGGDGPTDAAGAFACPEVLESALSKGLIPSEYLAENDSYGFFSKAGGHLVTGPTNTNVCDLQVLLVGTAPNRGR